MMSLRLIKFSVQVTQAYESLDLKLVSQLLQEFV